MIQKIEEIEAIVEALGLRDLSIPSGRSLESILKECTISSTEAYKTATSLNNRANMTQKALSLTLAPLQQAQSQ